MQTLSSPIVRLYRKLTRSWAASSLSKKLLAILSVLLVVYIPYQIWLLWDAADDQAMHMTMAPLGDQAVHLHMIYPRRLRLAGAAHPPKPLLFWLQPTTALDTSASPLTYTLSLTTAGNAVVFTDKDGAPSAPRLQLSTQSSTPAAIYVRRNGAASAREIDLQLLLSPVGTQAGDATEPITPQPITISLEKDRTTAFRHLASAMATNIVSLPVVIAGLGLLIWRQWQEGERAQREKMAKIQTALVETTRLSTLAQSDPVQAAAQWNKLQNEGKTDSIWADEYVKPAVNGVRLVITSQERWQERLLQSATAAMDLKAVAAQIIALDGEQPQEAALAARYLNGESIWLKDIEQNQCLSALLWLYQHCVATAGPQVTATIASLAASKLTPAWRVLTDDPHGRRLLRQAQIEPILEKRKKDEAATLTEEEENIIERLLIVIKEPPRWPPLWNAGRPADAVAIDDTLKQLELVHNPFGPPLAELDACLPDLRWILSQEPAGVTGRTPALLFGAPGAGNTAHALCLAHACTAPSPSIPATFPVYCPLLPADLRRQGSAQRLMAFIGDQVGAALISFLARNPYAFLDQEPANQAAMAFACLSSAGGRNNLLLRLRQAGLSGAITGEQFAAAMDRSLPFEIASVQLQWDWIETLGKARPNDFFHTYVIIDLHSRDVGPQDPVRLASSLNALAQIVAPLAARGVYLKLFLPDVLRPVIAQAMPPGMMTNLLLWTETDLAEMLKSRLRWASGGRKDDFNQLFDRQAITMQPQPKQRLITAAQGSPRQLVQLGNALLIHHQQHEPDHNRISSTTLETILHDSV